MRALVQCPRSRVLSLQVRRLLVCWKLHIRLDCDHDLGQFQ